MLVFWPRDRHPVFIPANLRQLWDNFGTTLGSLWDNISSLASPQAASLQPHYCPIQLPLLHFSTLCPRPALTFPEKILFGKMIILHTVHLLAPSTAHCLSIARLPVAKQTTCMFLPVQQTTCQPPSNPG